MKPLVLGGVVALVTSIILDLMYGVGPYSGRPWLAIIATILISSGILYLGSKPPETIIIATCAECGGLRGAISNPVDTGDLLGIITEARRTPTSEDPGTVFLVRDESNYHYPPPCRCRED